VPKAAAESSTSLKRGRILSSASVIPLGWRVVRASTDAYLFTR